VNGEQTFRIPVSNGLLEHCVKMGDAIWLFLWLIDATTRESANEKGNVAGKVLGGMPVRPSRIAESLGGVSDKTINRWRKKLVEGGYIEAKNTGHGFVYTVLKSKKKWTKMSDESGQKCPTTVDRNVPPDRTKMSNLISPNGKAGLPQRESRFPENGILYRQSSDKARTEQKNGPRSSASPSFEDIKKKLFENYTKRFPGQKMVWRKAENTALEVLIRDRTPQDIVIAHRSYLETEDTWERKHGFPFCSFAKKVSQYIVAEDDDNSPTAEDDRPPTYVPPKRAPAQ
jgi:hypothetical protein